MKLLGVFAGICTGPLAFAQSVAQGGIDPVYAVVPIAVLNNAVDASNNQLVSPSRCPGSDTAAMARAVDSNVQAIQEGMAEAREHPSVAGRQRVAMGPITMQPYSSGMNAPGTYVTTGYGFGYTPATTVPHGSQVILNGKTFTLVIDAFKIP